MGGCTNCKGKSGCDHRKGSMMASVDDALERLYPSKTWGEPDDQVVEGLAPDELAGLADELATTLRTANVVRPRGPRGGAGDRARRADVRPPGRRRRAVRLHLRAVHGPHAVHHAGPRPR